MKYDIIVADPPWAFSDKLAAMAKPVRRSATSHYQTLTLKEICDLDVLNLANPEGCMLALWVPGSLIESGLSVVKSWGFKHKQVFVWVKSKKPGKKPGVLQDPNDLLAFGMGRLMRQTHEIALIGTSGKSIYPKLKDHSQRSVDISPATAHSVKPSGLQDRLDLMFPDARKLEIFARRLRPAWTCIGDAVDGKDVKDSIHELVVL